MQSDIDDDDQPDMVGQDGTSKIAGNTRTSKTIFARYSRQGNRQELRAGRKTTGYDVARDGVDRSVAANLTD